LKGYLASYTTLFREQSSGAPRILRIEIPLIQRDYAQGRLDAATVEIRTDFLEVLLGAVAGGDEIGLDLSTERLKAARSTRSMASNA
jgi:hypothetical protein